MYSLARCHHLTMSRRIHRHQVIHENSTAIDHTLRLQLHLFSGLHIHELHPGNLPVLVMHNPGNLRFVKYHAPIIEQAGIPVVVDAGIGAPSHAAEAMELGASAVLVNTAIAVAGNPVEMAKAFKAATEAGRQAYEAGLGLQAVDFVAEASSPLTAFLD